MVMFQLPAMLLLLLPVIAVEAFVVRRELGLSQSEARKGVTRANVISTLVGIPLAWAVMLAVQLGAGYFLDSRRATPSVKAFDDLLMRSPIAQVASVPLLQVAWVGGEEWCIVLVAAAVLLIPSFFLSLWIEGKVCRRVWQTYSGRDVSRAVLRANAASYALLFAVFTLLWICLYPGYAARVRAQESNNAVEPTRALSGASGSP